METKEKLIVAFKKAVEQSKECNNLFCSDKVTYVIANQDRGWGGPFQIEISKGPSLEGESEFFVIRNGLIFERITDEERKELCDLALEKREKLYSIYHKKIIDMNMKELDRFIR